MSLQRRLDAFKSAFESDDPPCNAFRERLEDDHASSHRGYPAVGDLASAFELTNPDAAPVGSADLLAHGARVIAFSHGHW
jgi:hypothetical protein